jgi:hypothetical protein
VNSHALALFALCARDESERYRFVDDKQKIAQVVRDFAFEECWRHGERFACLNAFVP